jgi:hypothetical protein
VPRAPRPLAALVAAALVASAAAQGDETRAELSAGAWAVWGPAGRWSTYAYPGPLLHSPFPYWDCVAPWCLGADPYLVWRLLERQRRFDALRRGPAPAPAAPAWPAMPPPPTPESHIQPEYRHSGVVRPEFSDVGQPRP